MANKTNSNTIKGIINEENVANADVVLLSAPYEKTASSHKGTVHGPAKVIDCLNHQIEFFDRKYKKEVTNFIKTTHIELENLNDLTPEENLKTIRKQCEKILEQNKFIFLLGGEHAVSIGHFEALAKKYNASDVTILQIDAHCDLRNDDSDYSENPSNLAHSTVMRRASEMGYNLVQVGIRTYSKEEHDYFSDPLNRVKVFEWGKSIPSVAKVIKAIKTKYLYISIDVDGFDPAHMPGTGTAVQGGLEWYYGLELLEKAIAKKELIGADIVEVSPMEGSVLTEYGSAQLVYSMIAEKFKKRLK